MAALVFSPAAYKSAMSILTHGSKAFHFYRECAKANDVDVPENGRELGMMLMATMEPMQLCVDLAKRFNTLPLVEHAVTMARCVLSSCESLSPPQAALSEDDDDDDARPHAAGWKEWCQSKERGGDLEKLIGKLARAQQALQVTR